LSSAIAKYLPRTEIAHYDAEIPRGCPRRWPDRATRIVRGPRSAAETATGVVAHGALALLQLEQLDPGRDRLASELCVDNRPHRVAIQCRVSSAGQEDNSSLQTQEERCRAYAAERGWRVAGVYREVHTGTELLERPQFTELREATRRGEFDVQLVHALDRLSRKQTHQGLILSKAERAGLQWESATEDIDNSPQEQILWAVIGGMAKIERLKIAERTKRGKQARIDAGKYSFESHAPNGYSWADPTTRSRLVENEPTAPVVRRIFSEIATGESARQVSLCLTEVRVPTPMGLGTHWYWSTTRTIERNSLYWGEPRANRWRSERKPGGGHSVRPRPEEEQVVLTGVAPERVSAEELGAVHTCMERNKAQATRNNKNPNSALLRARFARCDYCGRGLEVQHAREGGRSAEVGIGPGEAPRPPTLVPRAGSGACTRSRPSRSVWRWRR
jgi:site-specific DNA recombinase